MGDLTRVLLVGLGTIARTHANVLARRADVDLVGGVDPQPVDWFDGQRWDDLDAALAMGEEPDLVVLATPTETHADLVDRVLTGTRCRILSEKPLAATPDQISALETRHGADVLARRLGVAHHFAFSPEVEWARGLVHDNPEWGLPTAMSSTFNDAYAGLPASRLDSVVSSWVDSGPNQLSIVAAFVDDWQVIAHSARRDRAVTTLDHGSGRTTLSSNWLAADSSKQTTLEFHGGAVRLRLDHTSMTALCIQDGHPVEHVGYAGTAGRKVAHYLGVYQALLGPDPDPRLGVDLAQRIATTLDAAGSRTRDDVTFTTITEASEPRRRS